MRVKISQYAKMHKCYNKNSLNILKKVIGKYDYDSIQVCSTPSVIKTVK